MYNILILMVFMLVGKFGWGQFNTIGENRPVPIAKKDTLTGPTFKYNGLELIKKGGGLDLLKYLFTKQMCSSPLGEIYITDFYGWRKAHPVTKKGAQHSGLDLRCKYKNVYAVVPGKITGVGYDNGLGNYIKLSVFDMEFVYGHLSEIYVEKGDIVENGVLIALSGHSGRVNGPHLHFEMKSNGKHVDPVNFIVFLFSKYH